MAKSKNDEILTKIIGEPLMVRHIEICGAIASGKTTLAQAFSKISLFPVLEDCSNIASLADFYKNQRKYAFETEISFTLHHYYQAKKALLNARGVVCDFSFVGDYAFATATLNKHEFFIYKPMFDYLLSKLGKPDKLIILQASTETLLKRIMSRNRAVEKHISAEYLDVTTAALYKAIKIIYSDVPSIIINTEKVHSEKYTLAFLKELLR